MKTSKSQFNRFKKAFLYWVDKFGLKGYKIYFYHKPREDYYAELSVNESGKAVTVIYSSIVKEKDQDPGPESHAKHEAIHLLLHKLVWLGGCRYLTSEEIDQEYESVAIILEKLL